MELTITLDGPTAALLRERASALGQPPEEAVRDIVDTALRKDAGEDAWERANQRRVELIYKDVHGGLSGEERQELERLQEAAIALVAPMDKRMIAEAEAVLRKVKELRGAANP